MLRSGGYFAEYGSVNFSKNKSETGTSDYFEGRLLDGKPYLGLGNYATSMIDNYWYFNTYTTHKYIHNINNKFKVMEDFYNLTIREVYAKYILYSLNFGILDELRFFHRFHQNIGEIFQDELNLARHQGWLYQEGNIWKICQDNFKNMSYIRSLFYSPQVQKWMINS